MRATTMAPSKPKTRQEPEVDYLPTLQLPAEFDYLAEYFVGKEPKKETGNHVKKEGKYKKILKKVEIEKVEFLPKVNKGSTDSQETERTGGRRSKASFVSSKNKLVAFDEEDTTPRNVPGTPIKPSNPVKVEDAHRTRHSSESPVSKGSTIELDQKKTIPETGTFSTSEPHKEKSPTSVVAPPEDYDTVGHSTITGESIFEDESAFEDLVSPIGISEKKFTAQSMLDAQLAKNAPEATRKEFLSSTTALIRHRGEEEKKDDEKGMIAKKEIVKEEDLADDDLEDDLDANSTSSDTALYLARGRSYQKSRAIEQEIQEMADDGGYKIKKYRYKPKDFYSPDAYKEIAPDNEERQHQLSRFRMNGGSFDDSIVSLDMESVNVPSFDEQTVTELNLPPGQTCRAHKRWNEPTKPSPAARRRIQEKKNESPEATFCREFAERSKSYLNLLYQVNCTSPRNFSAEDLNLKD